MALATKCPHCNTIFRVAHDQLKLRGGIVRCGACNEVFDGNAALVDPTPKQPVIIDLPEAAPAALAPIPAIPVQPILAAAPEAQEAPEAPAIGEPVAADMQEIADAPDLEHLDLNLDDDGVHEPVEPEHDTATASDAPVTVAQADQPHSHEHDYDLDFDIDPAPDAAPLADAARDEPDMQLDMPPIDAEFHAEFDATPDAAAQPEPEVELDAELAAHLDPYAAVHDDGTDQSPRGSTQLSDNVAADVSDLSEASHASHHPDGRREPTFDIPDEHLTAIALHDNFELDAHPHTLDHSLTDDNGVRHSNDGSDDDEDDEGGIVTLSSAATTAAGATALAAEPTAPATPVSASAPEEPGFVIRSRRNAQWGKASRIGMACGIPLLLGALAFQVVATFRNPLSANVPALKPALVSACVLLGCKVDLPSQIDVLAIEQGELQTMADNIFSFATSLRNQSATAQGWPHIELILNDSADQPVLRRVFAPREYLPAGADVEHGFLPRSEQAVKLHFELSRVKASGYHIAVFYP